MSQIKLTADSGGGTTSLKAPSSTTSNADVVLKLPVADGSANQVLKTDGSGQLSFTSNAGTTINNNADNRIITGSGTASTLNGESSFVFDGTNVGLGTSTPTSPDGSNADNSLNGPTLTVYGDSPAINLTSSTTGGSDYSLINFGRTGSSSNPYRAVIGYKQSDDILRINAQNHIAFDAGGGINASEVMRIDGSGRVGIGTNNPSQFHSSADDLVIQQSGHAGITIDSTSSTNSSIFFADGATGGEAYAGYVQYSHSDDVLRLGAATDTRVRIKQHEVEIVDGDLVIGTSGHGIDFSATAHATGMTSEILDDYEEGNYTPEVIIGGGQSGVTQPSTRNGSYTRVGDRVYFNIHITGTLSYTGSIYHGLHVSLPYNTNSYSYAALTVWFYAGVENEHEVISRTENNDNKLVLQYPGDSMAYRHVDGSWNMMISGHYEAA